VRTRVFLGLTKVSVVGCAGLVRIVTISAGVTVLQLSGRGNVAHAEAHAGRITRALVERLDLGIAALRQIEGAPMPIWMYPRVIANPARAPARWLPRLARKVKMPGRGIIAEDAVQLLCC